MVLEALAGHDPKDAGSLQRLIPPYREAIGQDLRGLRIGVLRHHWEEDMPASEDMRRAMDVALDVLQRLGAELDRPISQRVFGDLIDAASLAAPQFAWLGEEELVALVTDRGETHPYRFGLDGSVARLAGLRGGVRGGDRRGLGRP